MVANIAESQGCRRRGESFHFLAIARGSLAELDSHLTVAARLRLVRPADLAPAKGLSEEVAKMLTALVARVKAGRSEK